MRILQAEIRRKLYLKKRPEPTTDHDPWFVEMQEKLTHWKSSSPKNDEGSGISETWYVYVKSDSFILAQPKLQRY